jgi:hypothetical protein
MAASNPQSVGWSAIIGGVIGVIGFICLILLFVVGEPFGSINDFLSIPTGLLLLPLVVGLYRLHAPHYPLIGGLAALAGAAGFLSTMAGSALLLLGRIDFQQSLIPGMGGFGLIGLWALLNAALSLADGALPRPIALAGVLLGLTPTIILVLLLRVDAVANVLSAMASPTAAGFQMNPVVMALTALGMISYAGLPFWFIAVGRLFATGRVGAAVGGLISI